MPKSQFVERLDIIQKSVHTFLKPLGYRKKGRTFNRRTDGGLLHAINFQMGEYPLGENYVIPGLRENLYGKFAVNLGVYLPCVHEVEGQHPPLDFVQEFNCTIRQRLNTIAFGNGGPENWFEITDDTSSLATSLVNLLDRFGLSFLEQFQSYEDVLSFYNAHGELPFQNSGRASLDVALIAHHKGDKASAQSLFQKAYASNHKGFQAYVAELAKRVGYNLG